LGQRVDALQVLLWFRADERERETGREWSVSRWDASFAPGIFKRERERH
jgi:hypothetical protein